MPGRMNNPVYGILYLISFEVQFPDGGIVSLTATDVTEHHSKRVYPHTHQVLPKLHSHHHKSQDDDDEDEEEEEEEQEQGWHDERAYVSAIRTWIEFCAQLKHLTLTMDWVVSES